MMLMCRHCIPLMPRGSAIVNISSIGAARPGPSDGAYPLSKGGVEALTRELAVQHGGEQVRVNAVVPGAIWTPFAERVSAARGRTDFADLRRERQESTLLKTEGTGWDIAAAVAFLASEEAKWITGQMLVVDGGGSLPLWTGR
jgi:NAD(P)-dependent dehydrogenase (short-subunit alcohol dehydrogenase family)